MRPQIADVLAAAERIRDHVHRTPVLTSRSFDQELGCEVFFKAENLQRCGAFKARGACNAVFALSDAEAARGVCTHSSGNHAQALAYAAGRRGIPCTVVMPDTAPSVKVDAVRGYGAEIVFCEPGERQAICDRVAAERGAVIIHPYTNPWVIAGQATATLELCEQAPPLDALVVPVSGGGLCAGAAISLAARSPQTRLYAAEPEAADDAARSLRSGELQPADPGARTICDGLVAGLGQVNFEILSERGTEVLLVDDEQVVAAARSILERMKTVVEPSGATVLAALRRHAERFRGRRVGAIFSGGNTDFAWLRRES